ncbi:MAG: GrpB family protein [Dehalococcoidales bacterium]|nr:GrpB family protein [Dehalococcoidales bacterium]
MTKKLEDMTNEERWQLFPIILSEHQPEWLEKYRNAKTAIEKAIGAQNIVRLNHFGSTAIPGLIAKPTIDILLEIKDDTDIEKLKSDMRSIGFIYSARPENPAPRMMFLKGYTPQGFRGQAFHVHVRYQGDWDELYFKDYLLKYPEIADEYGKLKLSLQKKYEHDRNGYTEAKTEFIKRVTGQARAEGKKR